MGKTYEEIFNEFEGNVEADLTMGDGDVKYHLGFSSQYPVEGDKNVYLKLMPNPSHLEAVNPIVTGFARAKADAIYKSDYDKILPLLIHGDAAVAGQGIVYEVCKWLSWMVIIREEPFTLSSTIKLGLLQILMKRVLLIILPLLPPLSKHR
jgi:2-oxoglutarate dehydrogenase complex dehydrogenase (E1) component-like enzyme